MHFSPAAATSYDSSSTTTTRNQQQQQYNLSSSSHNIVIIPGPCDVLCGKDKSLNRFSGNLLFKKVIAAHLPEYAKCRRKSEKMKLTKEIVYKIKLTYGSKFLKKLNHDHQRGESWQEINDLIARDKVSHALRFAAKAKNTKNIKRNAAAAAAVAAPSIMAASSGSKRRHRGSADDSGMNTTLVENLMCMTAQQQSLSVNASLESLGTLLLRKDDDDEAAEQLDNLSLLLEPEATMQEEQPTAMRTVSLTSLQLEDSTTGGVSVFGEDDVFPLYDKQQQVFNNWNVEEEDLNFQQQQLCRPQLCGSRTTTTMKAVEFPALFSTQQQQPAAAAVESSCCRRRLVFEPIHLTSLDVVDDDELNNNADDIMEPFVEDFDSLITDLLLHS